MNLITPTFPLWFRSVNTNAGMTVLSDKIIPSFTAANQHIKASPIFCAILLNHPHSVCCGQDADVTCAQFFLGGGSGSLNGSESRGPCRRDSVVRRMLLSESWWPNLLLSRRQHGRLPAKSERRWPLKIM